MTDARLSAQVTADIADFLKRFDQLKTTVEKVSASPGKAEAAFESLGHVGSKVIGNLSLAIGALSFGAVSTQLLEITRVAAAQAEQVERLSAITGTSTDTMQEWGVALNRARLGPEDLTLAMRNLNLHVEAAKNPASEAAGVFERLGIRLSEVGSTEALIRILADRFAQMADPVERSALASRLLGRAGQELIPFLMGGSQAIDDAADAARRMGAVFSSTQLKTLSGLDDKFDDLGKAVGAFKTTVALALAPAATTITEKMTEATGAATRFFQAMVTGDEQMGPVSSRLKALAELLVTFGGNSPTKHLADDLSKVDVDALSQRFIDARSPEAQEGFGLKIRDAAIGAERLRQSLGRAQEALGQFTLTSLLADFREAQRLSADLFDIDVIQRQEKAMAEALARPDTSKLTEIQRAVMALRDLMPSLDNNEALVLATHNIQAGTASVQAAITAWSNYRQQLADAVEATSALEQHQAELFAAESVFIGAADAARHAAFQRIDAEEALKRQTILDTFGESERAQQKLLDLEERTMAQRMAVVRQYPTFWEQQLQAITNGNAFSVSSILGTWTSGIAQIAVRGGNLKQVWEATQIGMVQAGLNSVIQWTAGWLLAETTRTAATATANGVIVAGNTAAATASTSIWGGAAAAILGFFGTVTSGFAAMGGALVGVLSAVGTFVMGVLTAIAEALTATVFGIPYAGAILLGVAAIAVALAATGNLGFRDGGIGDFGAGTPATLHGREAIIPLNQRGAKFMQEAVGLGRGPGGSQKIVVPVYVNGRQIALATNDDTISALRQMGVPA